MAKAPDRVGDEAVDLVVSDDAGGDKRGDALHRREEEEREPLGLEAALA